MQQPTPEQLAELVEAAKLAIHSWEKLQWGGIIGAIARLRAVLKDLGVAL